MSINNKIFRRFSTFFLTVILVAVLSTVAFSVVSQTPLFLTTNAKPNIAILLDNSGSMSNMMYHPNFPTSHQGASWNNATFKDSADYQLLYQSGGSGNYYYLHEINTTNNFTGDSSGNFTYNGITIKLPKSNDANWDETRYNGAYLNWLFYKASTQDITELTSGSSYQKTRFRAAKDTIKTLITSSYNSSTSSYPYRWGIFTYTYDPTATTPVVVGKCSDTSTDVTAMLTGVENVKLEMNTPLGNSLLALWHYFEDSVNGPISSSCQKNFVIAITDGYPYIPDYPGYGHNYQFYTNYGGSDAISASAINDDFWYNPDYSTNDYYRSKAHIVTRRMHNEPARSGWSGSTIDTFVIGLAFGQSDADDQTLLLNKMAINGGGDSYGASDTAKLTSALNSTLNTIASRISSASSVAVNTAFLTSNTKLYRTKFNSGDWTGFLEAYRLDQSNGDVIGYPNTPLWEAGALLNSRATDRVIYTAGMETSQNYKRYNFTTDNATKISTLTLNPAVSFNNFSTASASSMTSYIRGDSTPTGYRQRVSKLGDMTYSAPVISGPPEGFYADNGYGTFKSTWAGRTSLIIAGANDGMLHAFNADTGVEQWAFIPNSLLPKLKLLRKDPYVHQNFVGGTPTIADAYIATKDASGAATTASWRTVLVCGLREGGKSYFAMDVTDPANPIPLWEMTPDNPSANGLGYTFGSPLILKLKDSSQAGGFRWVAALPNGYEGTTSGKAASIIIADLATGAIIKEIVVDTSTNPSAPTPGNGLSSPAAVDINADGFVEYIYAGDLQGNLWKFDVNNSDNSKWDVSYRGNGVEKPARALFTGLSTQPITTAPDIVLRSGCQIVFFGTGKYYDDSVDKTTTSTQSIYGLYDYNVSVNNPSASIYGRSNLQVQTITEVTTASGDRYRLASNTTFTAGTSAGQKLGWYVDLPSSGERIITDPVAHARRLIFTTFIPSTGVCSFGGTSWLMELNMDTGGAVTYAVFDVNKDGRVDCSDTLYSGYGLGDGIASKPTIIGSDHGHEYKYITKTTGEIIKVIEGGAGPQFSLRNWRQLR